jgi:CspA family cold shock protein
MPRGRVKWFNTAKGYGFIADDGGGEIFVHLSEIRTNGSKSLTPGELVEFRVVRTPKGLKAVEVHRIGLAGKRRTKRRPKNESIRPTTHSDRSRDLARDARQPRRGETALPEAPPNPEKSRDSEWWRDG